MTDRCTDTVENRPQKIDSGVWFKSAASGLWYQNHQAAGTVLIIRVDGKEFLPLPRELTAENGAKAALIGEFNETVEQPVVNPCGCGGCHICDMFHNSELDGPNYETIEVPVSWSNMKKIYRRAVQWFLCDRMEED